VLQCKHSNIGPELKPQLSPKNKEETHAGKSKPFILNFENIL
jgi:hypothetical protein